MRRDVLGLCVFLATCASAQALAQPAQPLIDAALVQGGGCAQPAQGDPRCWGLQAVRGRLAVAGAHFICAWGDDAQLLLSCWSVAHGQAPWRLQWASPPAQLAASGDQLCALEGDGQVSCALLRDRPGPLTLRPQPELAGAQRIAAGDRHVCAMTQGRVTCLGDGMHGASGRPFLSREPVAPIAGLDDATLLWAQGDSTCAHSARRGLLCWGRQPWLERPPSSAHLPRPTPLGPSTPRALSAGRAHLCALDDAQQRWCLGSNSALQISHHLGRGWIRDPVKTSWPPKPIKLLDHEQTSCAITAQGQLACSGAGRGPVWIVRPPEGSSAAWLSSWTLRSGVGLRSVLAQPSSTFWMLGTRAELLMSWRASPEDSLLGQLSLRGVGPYAALDMVRDDGPTWSAELGLALLQWPLTARAGWGLAQGDPFVSGSLELNLSWSDACHRDPACAWTHQIIILGLWAQLRHHYGSPRQHVEWILGAQLDPLAILGSLFVGAACLGAPSELKSVGRWLWR